MALKDQVVTWLAQQEFDAYLVGGSVRDPLLGRKVYDIDLVVDGDGLRLAKRIADRFGGAFFPLDKIRRTGRAILYRLSADPLVVDVAGLRGPNLEADLTDRDFTINALAVDVSSPDTIIDHHGGLADLSEGLIRIVTPASIRNDPLRSMRAVRLAAQLDFDLTAETVAAIHQDGGALAEISGERIRDELVHLLFQSSAAPYLETLEELGLLFLFLPELEPLREVAQSPPHHLDVLRHSVATVGALEDILRQLRVVPVQKKAEGVPYLADLDAYAERIWAHLSEPLSGERTRLIALKLAALLHDVGKPAALEVDDRGRTRFIGHEKDGVRIVAPALRRLRFSGAEVRLVETIIRNHMRPLLLAAQSEVSRRAVYRFFRATGDAGVEVILHALADQRATYYPGSGEQVWSQLLSVAVRMLGDYWEYRSERVSPPPLTDGHDLMSEFGLQPGPQIGDLLEAVREAQAADRIHSREEAMALVRSLLGLD